MKITKITNIQPGIYAFVCPLCGSVLASASDTDLMPEIFICNCDTNGNKQPVFDLFESSGKTMIRHNKQPRFIGEVVFGQLSDIENIKWLDECSVDKMAKIMRKAGEFLIKSSHNGKTS